MANEMTPGIPAPAPPSPAPEPGRTDVEKPVIGDGGSQSPGGTYHPYVGGRPYDDGYVRPSQEDLDAERRKYEGYGDPTIADQGEAEPVEPPDTSMTKTNLLNSEANAEANRNLLKTAGYDLENPPKSLTVPDQVALPGMVDLPSVALPNRIANPDVALPDEIALPNNIDLPNRLDLPEYVATPDEINFEQAMREAGVNVGRIGNIDIEQEKAMLDQLTEAQRQQAILNANRNIEKGTVDLQRNMEDAQGQFASQRNQVDLDEQRALDNQALYNEARGDRGGIGQSQYNSIQNTAATNRLMVQQEQTQLATDTARQIADLRAQGEFEKANQLLSISQNYLSQLMDLYTWAKEANIGIDEFNLQVAQWEESYKLSLVDAQIEVQNSNLNLAQARMEQAMNQFSAAYNQENSLYNARWQQAQQLFEDAYNQANSQYNARWNQAQQLWQNEYQQENSLYNAAWDQATDLFNAQYNQENSQFEARRNVANDYFNNMLNAANYDINARKAILEAMINSANATGAFTDGTATYTAQQDVRQVLAASGQALLEKGIIPTAEQMEAMGMTPTQAAAYVLQINPSADVSGLVPGGSASIPGFTGGINGTEVNTALQGGTPPANPTGTGLKGGGGRRIIRPARY